MIKLDKKHNRWYSYHREIYMKLTTPIEIVSHYAVKYFGNDYKEIVYDRLKKSSLYLIDSQNYKECAADYTNNMLEENDSHKSDTGREIFSDTMSQLQKLTDRKRIGVCISYPIVKNRILSLTNGAFIIDPSGDITATDLSPWCDVAIVHELVHAMTNRISNNGLYIGINDFGENKNENIVHAIATEITKEIHKDKISLYENKPKNTQNRYIEVFAINQLPKDFIKKHKNLIFPAMLQGKKREELALLV